MYTKNGLEQYVFSLRIRVLQNTKFLQNEPFFCIFPENIQLFQYVSLDLIQKKFHGDLDVSKEVENGEIQNENREKLGLFAV